MGIRKNALLFGELSLEKFRDTFMVEMKQGVDVDGLKIKDTLRAETGDVQANYALQVSDNELLGIRLNTAMSKDMSVKRVRLDGDTFAVMPTSTVKSDIEYQAEFALHQSKSDRRYVAAMGKTYRDKAYILHFNEDFTAFTTVKVISASGNIKCATDFDGGFVFTVENTGSRSADAIIYTFSDNSYKLCAAICCYGNSGGAYAHDTEVANFIIEHNASYINTRTVFAMVDGVLKSATLMAMKTASDNTPRLRIVVNTHADESNYAQFTSKIVLNVSGGTVGDDYAAFHEPNMAFSNNAIYGTKDVFAYIIDLKEEAAGRNVIPNINATSTAFSPELNALLHTYTTNIYALRIEE